MKPKLPSIAEIFLLHHDADNRRLIFQKDQFHRLGIQYTLCKSIVFAESNGFQNKAIKSCYASHLSIIEKIILRNYIKPCLILEDDIVFYQEPELIDKFVTNILDNYEWDMIYLYRPKNLDQILEEHDTFYYVDSMLNAHAYIISPKVIKDIYNDLKNYFMTINDSNKKIYEQSHIDQIIKHYIHPKYKVIASKDNIINQNKEKFGSQLGWGYKDSKLIID